MTVTRTQDLLVVRHVFVGFSSLLTNLPELSLEMALWLEGQWLAIEANKDLGFINQDWVIRSSVAAYRYYKPALATSDYNLTALGRHAGEVCHFLLEEIRQNNHDLTKLSYVKKADEILISATFPKRTIKLLTILNRAIEIAIANYKTGATAIMQSATLAPVEEPVGAPMNYLEYKQVNYEVEDFKPEIFNTEQEPFCLIPTAKLPGKARFDINILLKFGLLDLRFLRARGRGRPRMAVKISDLGTTFLEDLGERRLV
jgi:hypothetical protein